MRIHRLIPIIVSLVTLAATTLTAIQPRSAGVQERAAVQQPISTEDTIQSEADGITPAAQNDTTEESETELFLDRDEVEKLATAEKNGSPPPVKKLAVSFRHVPVPLPPGGLDHVVAGVSTRNRGRGTIRLRGVPPAATLVSATLVWGEIAAAALPAPPAAGSSVGFRANCGPVGLVPNVFIGAAPQPCWNPAGTFFAYSADVAAFIVAGINGDYEVSGLRSFITNGRCPWPDVGVAPGANCAGPGNALPLSEGASLLVTYNHPCIPPNAQVFIHVPNPLRMIFFGNQTFTHLQPVPPIPANTTLANFKHSRIGADGQVGVANCGLRAIPPITDERTVVAGVPIRGPLPLGFANRDADWNGDDGEPLNKLWDSQMDIFRNPFTLPSGAYTVTYTLFGDCVVPVVHVLGVR